MRKLYNMPPTDPRFLALTDEQIELEYQHYLLDHPELGDAEQYHDPNYEHWEQQAMQEDARVSYSDVKDGSAETLSRVKKRNEELDFFDSNEWEEVERDDEPAGEGEN